MSDNTYAHSPKEATDIFAAREGNLFERVMQIKGATSQAQDEPARDREETGATGAVTSLPVSPGEDATGLFRSVRPNIVQSIRAFRVHDLAGEARALQQHFLYAHCTQAQSRQEVLETISTSFLFPKHFGKNYDALYDSLTDLIQKAGEQPGFVIVLEGLPIAQKFDKEGRENLLDVFREAAEFWAEHKVPFRAFYSFA